MRPVRGALLAGLGLLSVDTAAGIALPLLVRHGLDSGVASDDGTVLAVCVLLAAVAVAAGWAALNAHARITRRAGERVLYGLRVRAYAHLQRLGMDFYERERGGQVMTRVVNDIDALSSFLQNGLLTSVASLATITGAVCAMVAVHPPLALAALALLPFVVAATVIFWWLSSAAYEEARQRIGEVNSSLQENVSGLRTAQAQGAGRAPPTTSAAFPAPTGPRVCAPSATPRSTSPASTWRPNSPARWCCWWARTVWRRAPCRRVYSWRSCCTWACSSHPCSSCR
ncbi:ABC transporter transmembrane domain-containing protein [Streptomyces sp. M19]